jgi:DNA-binding transcriptional MerR regulator
MPLGFWSLDELTAKVALALADLNIQQASGRVNLVPDQRTIRFYTTKGVLAPPEAFRGRTALYGEKHLRQLVAIKRLQAKGLSLVEVQARLLGATDAQIGELAGIPVNQETPILQTAASPQDQSEEAFWKTPPAPYLEPTRHRTVFALVPGIELTLPGVLSLDDYDAAALRAAAAPLLKLIHQRILSRTTPPSEEN